MAKIDKILIGKAQYFPAHVCKVEKSNEENQKIKMEQYGDLPQQIDFLLA